MGVRNESCGRREQMCEIRRAAVATGRSRPAYDSAMDILLSLLAAISVYSRPALFVATCIAAAFCGISWAARTRQINSFSPLARFAREKVDPYLRGIEGPVLNAGGAPTSVPWWGLAAFVVLGILLQSMLGYVAGIVASTALGLSGGPRAAVRALAQLSFAVLQVALMVRVLSSWFGALSRARWLRWTYTVTEPLLRPLRAVIPSLGPFDMTPLILYYLLQIVGSFVVSAI